MENVGSSRQRPGAEGGATGTDELICRKIKRKRVAGERSVAAARPCWTPPATKRATQAFGD